MENKNENEPVLEDLKENEVIDDSGEVVEEKAQQESSLKEKKENEASSDSEEDVEEKAPITNSLEKMEEKSSLDALVKKKAPLPVEIESSEKEAEEKPKPKEKKIGWLHRVLYLQLLLSNSPKIVECLMVFGIFVAGLNIGISLGTPSMFLNIIIAITMLVCFLCMPNGTVSSKTQSLSKMKFFMNNLKS